MACFIIPAGLGVITTLLSGKFPERWNVKWLNAILWGAVAMLMVEHVAHGEIVPYPPFLTAGIVEALPEMLNVGGPMALASVSFWALLTTADSIISRKSASPGFRRILGIHQ